jgi:thiopeptide-type bacteriocin biosynthesis protein
MKAELLTTPGATPEKVDRVIDELLQQTLLISDLRPPLTTHSPARYVVERLGSMSASSARQAYQLLDRVLEEMRAWDELPMTDRTDRYRDLVSQLNSAQTAQINPPLQVDTALRLTGRQINREVAIEAARAAELLLRLSPWPPSLATLSGYRRSFESRYGLEREVPLLELLDPGFGLGPPDGHPWQGGGIGQQKGMQRQQALRDIALGALRDRRLVVDLDPDTIAKLETWSPEPSSAPPSLDVSVFVLAPSRQAIDAGHFLVVVGPNLGAPAAGRNLGRFADLCGAEAEAALQSAARAETAHRPRHLVAESVYMPRRLRSANVAIRPAIREYEVVSGTMPGVPPDRMIPLGELVVGVRDGRFYVRWPAAGAEVVVCAGHMLNYRQAPAVLRFLEDVGRDGLVQMSAFDWGPAAGFPFLPRIQAGRIVLASAQWRVDVEMSARELPPEPSAAFLEKLLGWRAHWAVPRHVYLSVGDNRLLLDLEAPDQAELLRSELSQLKASGSVVLQEPLPGPEHAWAPGTGGGRLTELVVPVVLGQAASESPDGSAPAPRALQPAPLSTRMRPPGSEWLFLKLYCPRALDEDLIAGPLRAFCDAIVPAGLAEDWFFVRYSDPDPHLRVRFRGGADRMLRHTLPEVCAWASDLMTDGWCQRFGFDSYDREVERYGGAEGMEVAEAIFGADSRAVAEVLHLYAQRLLTLDRTTLAVLSFDDLLAGLGLGERERFHWYREQVAATAENAKEYRGRQATIRPLLGDPEQLGQQPGGELLAVALTARRVELASAASRLDRLQYEGRLQQPKSLLCRSYLHLHHNRLLGGGPPHEDLILGLLRRAREGLDKAPIRQIAETGLKRES